MLCNVVTNIVKVKIIRVKVTKISHHSEDIAHTHPYLCVELDGPDTVVDVTILFPRANHLPLFQHGQRPSRSGTFQKHALACFFLLASIYYLHAFYAMLTILIPRLSHYAQRPYPMPIPHYLHIVSSYELHAHSALFTYTYHMFSHTSTMLSLSI